MTHAKVWNGIVVAGDEGLLIEPHGEPRDLVLCDHCDTEFAPSDAAGATFDGSTGRYRCPVCGEWSSGPLPA